MRLADVNAVLVEYENVFRVIVEFVENAALCRVRFSFTFLLISFVKFKTKPFYTYEHKNLKIKQNYLSFFFCCLLFFVLLCVLFFIFAFLKNSKDSGRSLRSTQLKRRTFNNKRENMLQKMRDINKNQGNFSMFDPFEKKKKKKNR